MPSKSERIADDLRSEINGGVYPKHMPSEPELIERYGVSRGTVRAAMAALASEGLVIVEPGRGWSVRRYDPLVWEPDKFEHLGHRRDTTEAGHDAWQAEAAAQQRTPGQQVELAIVKASPLIAERLNVSEGESVVVRKRLRLVDSVPYQTADSYYPMDVAQGTPIMDPGDVIIPGGLMTAAGHRQVRFTDEISIRMPSKEETARLSLPAMTPVAEHVRTGFNEAGRPVRTIITILPGDRHKIVYYVGAE